MVVSNKKYDVQETDHNMVAIWIMDIGKAVDGVVSMANEATGSGPIPTGMFGNIDDSFIPRIGMHN